MQRAAIVGLVYPYGVLPLYGFSSITKPKMKKIMRKKRQNFYQCIHILSLIFYFEFVFIQNVGHGYDIQTPKSKGKYLDNLYLKQGQQDPRSSAFHSPNNNKWHPYQIVGGKPVQNVQIDPLTTEIWPKEIFVTLSVME